MHHSWNQWRRGSLNALAVVAIDQVAAALTLSIPVTAYGQTPRTLDFRLGTQRADAVPCDAERRTDSTDRIYELIERTRASKRLFVLRGRITRTSLTTSSRSMSACARCRPRRVGVYAKKCRRSRNCVRWNRRILFVRRTTLLDVFLPVFRDVVLRENRGHRTRRLARSTIDTFSRMDVEHWRSFEIG